MKDNGGPAFPIAVEDGTGSYTHYTGITLRDYFAAQALVGFCANLGVQVTSMRQAQIAYTLADAMLKEREK